MYCSSECRQAAADQYHRVLCLGPSQEDPDHPINKLKDAWRWESFVQIWSPMCCFFSLMRRLTSMEILSSVQEHALPAGDLQHHADGPDGRCCQTGESVRGVWGSGVCTSVAGVLTKTKHWISITHSSLFCTLNTNFMAFNFAHILWWADKAKLGTHTVTSGGNPWHDYHTSMNK